MTTQAQIDNLQALSAQLNAKLAELVASPEVPPEVAQLQEQVVDLSAQLASKTQEYLASQSLLNATMTNLGNTQNDLIATTNERNALKSAIEVAVDQLGTVRLNLASAAAA
jgi:DNA repair ATPase RecN